MMSKKSRDDERAKPVSRSSSNRGGARPGSGRAEARAGRELWEWASGEMGYSSAAAGELEDGSPGQEEMKMLVRGEMMEFWKYVIKHVKSSSNAAVISGNLFLHSKAEVGGGPPSLLKTGAQAERGVVEGERNRLEREQASLRLAVQQMERDVAQLRENITQQEVTSSGVRGEVSQLSRSSALLAAHSLACQEMRNALHEFARRIRTRVDVFRPVEKEVSYYTRQGVGEEERGGDGSTAHGLESACTHEVRNVCSQLEQTMASRETGGQRSAEGERARGEAWKQIEALLSRYPAASILSSLVEITQHAAWGLQSHTDAIDLTRDAQQLKYSSDSTGMRDMSEETSLLHSVEEKLLEAQLSHIQKSVESERALMAAREAQSRTVGLQGEAWQLLQEHYGESSEALELARINLRLDLECAGSSAALERLTALCSSLGRARDLRKTVLEQLQAQHKRILEFAQVADSKQSQIQTLVAHNSSAKNRLLKQTVELQVYVQQNVLGHRGRLGAAVGLLRDGAGHEVQLFTNLSVDRLLTPPGLELPVCDLSIHRLAAGVTPPSGHPAGVTPPSGHPSWGGIMQSLKLPTYSSADTVLSKLLENKEKAGSLDRNVAKVNRMLQEMRLIAVDKQATQTILRRCQDHDRNLRESGVPAVQECLSRVSCALADCRRTEETLEHWWAQPAQFLTPWATQGGMTCGQWVEQWRVLAAKFGELLEQ